MATEGQGVHCVDLERSFESAGVRQAVLKRLRFDAEPGQLTMLIGPSGCGKTTLISIIAGLLRSDSGQVRVLGSDLAQLGADGLLELRLKRIGFVFQQYNLFPHRTALQNVMMAPVHVLRQDRAEVEARARRLLAKVRLSDKADAYPGELSGGQQQRVAIARALALEIGRAHV